MRYLVTVGGVLGRPGGDGDGVWLTAGVSQAVCVLAGLPVGPLSIRCWSLKRTNRNVEMKVRVGRLFLGGLPCV